MRIHLSLLAVIPLSFAACTDAGDPSTGSKLSIAPTDPPTSLPGPRIQRVAWSWHGCGNEANPLPFSLVVHVDVDGSADPVTIKGEAVGCDEFFGNDQLATCTASPQAIVRVLTVEIGNQLGEDVQSIPLEDCVAGKQELLP